MAVHNLTQQRSRILRYLVEGVRQRGRVPTTKEICRKFGFASPRAVTKHLQALEAEGYVERRGAPLGPQLNWDRVWEVLGIPILGRVPAGTPRLADAELRGTLTPDDVYPAEEGVFALEVQGESMTGEGIRPGDLVIIREDVEPKVGDIVVAVIEEDYMDAEATVKKLAQRDGKYYLDPANSEYEPIPLNGGRILGRVIRVIRYT